MHLDRWKSLTSSSRTHPGPAQDCKRTQYWLMKTLTEVWEEEVLPPSSPDCNPFRYFVWGEFEIWVSAKSRNKTEDLIQKIKEGMGSLITNTMAKVCKSLKSRIETVITADGSFNK